MKERKKRLSVLNVLLLIGIIPAIAITAIMITISVQKITGALEEGSYGRLQACATSVAQYFLYDIEEDILDPTDDLSLGFIDSLKSLEIEMTLFRENVRETTSILDSSNATGRNIGTVCDPEIWEMVKKGNAFSSDNVIIGGERYYTVYVPLTLNDGTVWGMGFAGEKAATVDAHIKKIVNSVIMVAVLVFALSTVAIVVIAKGIQKAMKKIVNQLQTIASGSLIPQTKASSAIKEISQIADSTEELREKLVEVVSQVKENAMNLDKAVTMVDDLSEETSEVTDAIASAIEELSTGNLTLAENVESVNSEMFHMETNIADIHTNVNALSDNSNTIKKANADATDYIDKVFHSSEKSVTAVTQISEQIGETNKAVSKIDEAVAMITSIASQTNLLSLNASIEAARAGEAGRGFAVVADEIRVLADQSKTSAEEIQTIINEVKLQSDKTVKLSALVYDVITEEKEYVKEAQGKFEILSEEVETSMEKIASINNQAENLNTTKETIVSSVSDLSAISEENAASGQEMTASVHNISEEVAKIKKNSARMRTMSEQLNESVSYFVLEEN